jgi:hypothetical protein
MDLFNATYLDTSKGNWSSSLLCSYGFLRHSWETEWVGLPKLVRDCVNYLNLLTAKEDPEVQNLVEAALAIAHHIEEEKGCGTENPEPSYHNRLHFADSLTTMTLQCMLEIRHGAEPDLRWLAALLLMALSHDFRHSGRINRHVSEIESNSVQFLIPILMSKNVDRIWINRISDVILRTDFSLVKENHSRVAGRAFQWDLEWATVLLNEADVMASASHIFGPLNSIALSLEWEAINFPPFATVATETGRRQFLSTLEFSSYSGRLLSADISGPVANL